MDYKSIVHDIQNEISTVGAGKSYKKPIIPNLEEWAFTFKSALLAKLNGANRTTEKEPAQSAAPIPETAPNNYLVDERTFKEGKTNIQPADIMFDNSTTTTTEFAVSVPSITASKSDLPSSNLMFGYVPAETSPTELAITVTKEYSIAPNEETEIAAAVTYPSDSIILNKNTAVAQNHGMTARQENNGFLQRCF
ncbi:hypothetical protein HZB07_01710 [Candidatus Saganbacteria bacterium]|nr:hypothetical protein [Candidatus Saganbacteria bacterium]